MVVADLNNNGKIDQTTNPATNEVLQETHYYPFGMRFDGPWAESTLGAENKYRYNGKELVGELGLNWYAYGARYYDAAIGRFTGVDPISDEFPWVSTYNYAENRPVDGIDLWGLQYVSSNSALFRVYRMQTWKPTGQQHHGVDSYGYEYIGTSVPINSVGFNVPKSGTAPQGISRAMKNLTDNLNTRRSTLQIAKSTNAPDRRFNTTKAFQSDLRSAGRIGLIFEAVNLTVDIKNAIDSYKQFRGTDESSKQLVYIEKAWYGVVQGINQGFFQEDQISIDNLSNVADYLYRGTPIKDEALQGVATKISTEILHNAQPSEVTYPYGGGLDNFKGPGIIKYN